MANSIFRSDASMQDTGAPNLVLLILVIEPLTIPASLPSPAAYLEDLAWGTNAAGSPTLALRITCSQLVPIEKPKSLLVIGSDRRCNLILDRAHADPIHCRILAQLNSGFDVWIIRDYSTSGTYYKRLKRQEDPHNSGEMEGLGDEEFVCKNSVAVQGLRYLRVGPYTFNCIPTADEAERAERDRWFRRHEPILVSTQMLEKQLKGKKASLIRGKKIGEGGFGQVYEYMEKHTGLVFAVKKLMSGNDREFENFFKEAQSMEKLKHVSLLASVAERT